MLASELIARIALATVFAFAAAFALFESIYLRDQEREFESPAIGFWKWAFRAVTLGCFGAILAVACLG